MATTESVKREIKNLPRDFKPLGRRVDDTFRGQRIDSYLAAQYPFLSRSGWKKRLANGELRLLRELVSASYRLKGGEQFYFFHPQSVEPEVDKGIQILYQKAGVLVAYKPAGLPMHENGPYRKNTFAYVLTERTGAQWAAIHRLDLETSGVVICGENTEIRGKLTRALLGGGVEKEYHAITRGTAKEARWRVDAPIGNLEESIIRIKKWVVPNGVRSVTDFELIECKHGHSYIRAYPRTGRTNQIRIHAAYSGLPLVGDRLFHDDETIFTEHLDYGLTERVLNAVEARRCFLHAYAVRFSHPQNGERVEVEFDLPDDMRSFWNRDSSLRSE